MPVKYVKTKTANWEVTRNGQTMKSELLWGDRVEVATNPPQNGVISCKARGAEGRIDASSLGDESLLEIYFIDVGQGDGVLIRTPDDRHILIDGGFQRAMQPSGKNAADFVDWKFSKDYGQAEIHLDAMIASHNDADHYGGLWDLLNPAQRAELDCTSVNVDAFYHAGVGWWAPTGGGARTLGKEVVDAHGDKYLVTLLEDRAQMKQALRGELDFTPQGHWGQFLSCVTTATPAIRKIERLNHRSRFVPGFEQEDGKASLRVLGPVEFDIAGTAGLRSLGSSSQNTNGNSILLRVDYGRTRILLTGDLNAKAQRVLLEQFEGERLEFAADVIKGCHHGSDDCSFEFLSAVQAGATIISSGDNESHSHPRPAIVAASAVTGHRRVDRDRLVTPLVYSTEISRSVRLGKVTKLTVDGEEELNQNSPGTISYNEVASGALRPKKGERKWAGTHVVAGVVYGLVNVRTDGKEILCATLNEKENKWDCEVFESRF